MQGWWAASYVVLWLLVIMLAVVVVALARQIGTLHLRLGPRGALEIDDEGPALGEPLSPIEAWDTSGERVVLGGAGEAQLLLFVSPGCSMCEEVLPSIPVVAASHSLVPYVVSELSREETAVAYGKRDLHARLIPSAAAARAYRVPGTPYALVIDNSGVVRAKGTVNNLEQMEGLLDTAARRMEAGALQHG